MDTHCSILARTPSLGSHLSSIPCQADGAVSHIPRYKLGHEFQTGPIVAAYPSSSSVWSKGRYVIQARPSRDLFSEETAKLEGAWSPTGSLLLEIPQFEMPFLGMNFCRLLNALGKKFLHTHLCSCMNELIRFSVRAKRGED